MARRYDELAEALDELSMHYDLDGRGRLSRDCQMASAAIKQETFIPTDPSDIDDVSIRVRDFIAEFRVLGEIPKLTEMREKRPYMSELTRISSVGPKTAEQIYQQMGVETIDGMKQLDEDGKLEDIDGIGPKTATTIRRSIAQL